MKSKPYLHRAKYYETDQMAIVHHSNYIRWFEDARIEWMEQAGIPYDAVEKRGIIIPVIGVTAEYRSMTHFREQVAVSARLEQYNSVRFTISYEVRNAETGELRCTGTTSRGKYTFPNMDAFATNVLLVFVRQLAKYCQRQMPAR